MCLVLCAGGLIGCANRETVEYPYHQPLDSPGEKFGGLPPAVQKSIRAQVGSADMYDIRKLNDSGHVVYQIVFRDWQRYPPLYVRSDGSIMRPDGTIAVGAGEDDIGAMSGGAMGGLRFSDLPIAVANTVHDKAPTAEVAYIHKVNINGYQRYEISFKNEARYPRMIIEEDGTLVSRPQN
jgi:hypothetical protein